MLLTLSNLKFVNQTKIAVQRSFVLEEIQAVGLGEMILPHETRK
jgi:hypothetical protein